MYSIFATREGFVTGGGKDNHIRIWNWQYEVCGARRNMQRHACPSHPITDLQMLSVSDASIFSLDSGVRCIACLHTPEGHSLSQMVVRI